MITERANAVRKRIPFAFWLVYDVAMVPVIVWAVWTHLWALPAAGMWAVAVFFDVNEAIVKWSSRA